MLYHIGIQHLHWFSLRTTQICLKFQINSLSEENICNFKTEALYLLYSTQPKHICQSTFWTSWQNAKEYKIIVMIGFSQNRVLLCP